MSSHGGRGREWLTLSYGKICALEADKQALQRRCTDVEESANRSRRQAEDARDRLQDVLEEVSKLKEACAGKDSIALEARAEAKYASERLAAEWGREKAELKATNEVLTKRLVSGGVDQAATWYT